MSRTLTKPSAKPAPSAVATPKKKESYRELVEQIVVAFILAFLIRGFAVEAFVIPTGSMAPTLYGQHKEVTCPQCGVVFAVNAAQESQDGLHIPEVVGSATCPNCRYHVANLDESPSFKGDRILVMKFLYDLPRWLGGLPPARWDVVVFHYPEEPETNYIKRLIGLPNEVLRIYFGDILTRPQGSDEPFRIQRKPLKKQQDMQQLVWDDAHRPRAFADRSEWKRWAIDPEASAPDASWVEGEGGAYRGAATAGWSTLGYRNLDPTPEQWESVLAGDAVASPILPTLITDYYGYNSGVTTRRRFDYAEWYQPHWVGDLTVSGTIKATEAKGGMIALELIEGGVPHRCEIDLDSGQATLSRDGKTLGDPAPTSLRADGSSHDFAFANVDDRLTLWIDGETPFDEGRTYEAPEDHPGPTSADLKPVTIAVKRGEVEVSGLVLKRDLYYTQSPSASDYDGLDLGWPADRGEPRSRMAEAFEVLSNPAMFASLGGLKWTDYPIAPGRYMMMGDNSPMSKDGRAWGLRDSRGDGRILSWAKAEERDRWEVPQELLIGKAFFVFWPHGVPFWPNLGVPLPPNFKPSRDLRFPFRPYFERMKWIR